MSKRKSLEELQKELENLNEKIAKLTEKCNLCKEQFKELSEICFTHASVDMCACCHVKGCKYIHQEDK